MAGEAGSVPLCLALAWHWLGIGLAFFKNSVLANGSDLDNFNSKAKIAIAAHYNSLQQGLVPSE